MKTWRFQISKIVSLNSFWHFYLHFVLKALILDIFHITEKKQQTKNQQFFDVIFDDPYLT